MIRMGLDCFGVKVSFETGESLQLKSASLLSTCLAGFGN